MSSSVTKSSKVIRFRPGFPEVTETVGTSKATASGSFAAIGSALPYSAAASIIGTDTRLGNQPSKPAAITVTRTSSPSASSITVPKIIFASG